MSRDYDLANMMVEYAKHFIGTWYSWGGDDPSGFDCSGLVVACLKAMGKLVPKIDLTAHQLFNLYPNTNRPSPGDLVCFFGEDNRVVHIGIYWTKGLYFTASGGGSHVKTKEDAIKHNAFVKVRPVTADRRPHVFVGPFEVKDD